MQKSTEYYAVTLEGKFIEAQSFQELQDKLREQGEQDIEMYVAFMYDKSHPTPSYPDKYWWPQIQIINKDKNQHLINGGCSRLNMFFQTEVVLISWAEK
uniref:hypothetical protein n=1 Tax=Alistipes megaguti TaxID=2364787 RepID=UPI000EFD4CF5|nr:hypothetical protein [Alistipes megaguti]